MSNILDLEKFDNLTGKEKLDFLFDSAQANRIENNPSSKLVRQVRRAIKLQKKMNSGKRKHAEAGEIKTLLGTDYKVSPRGNWVKVV